MEKLRCWLGGRGFRLSVRNNAETSVEILGPKVVEVNARLGYEARVVSLMHECGHVCVALRRRRSGTLRVAGATWREFVEDIGRLRRVGRASRIAELEEELAAWDRGERLARRLGVRFVRRVFERERTASLMTYVSYADAKMRRRRPRRRSKR